MIHKPLSALLWVSSIHLSANRAPMIESVDANEGDKTRVFFVVPLATASDLLLSRQHCCYWKYLLAWVAKSNANDCGKGSNLLSGNWAGSTVLGDILVNALAIQITILYFPFLRLALFSRRCVDSALTSERVEKPPFLREHACPIALPLSLTRCFFIIETEIGRVFLSF